MTGASLSSAPSTASISPVSPLLTLNLPLDCSFHHNCQINFLLSLSPLQFQLIEPWKKSITGVLSSMTMSLFLSLVDPPWYSKCHMGALPDSHLIKLQNLLQNSKSHMGFLSGSTVLYLQSWPSALQCDPQNYTIFEAL